MQSEQVKEAIISGYRAFINHRYDYEKITSKYDVPASITKEVLDDLRTYYLTYVYPEYRERKALEKAFDSLDRYIQQPQKLIAILFDASRLIFKYGRSLPKILGTGLKALQTFKAAQNFENTLVEEVQKLNMNEPYDDNKIQTLLKAIPKRDIQIFIETSQSLFETLEDRPQVEKIKEIIKYIIQVMKQNKRRYTVDQIQGLEMGFALLNEGDQLLQQLPVKDQKRLIYLITEIETDMLNNLE